VFCHKQKLSTSITLYRFFNYVEIQSGNILKQVHSDNGSKYISNELQDVFLTSGIIHHLIPPYSPESNGITDGFHQISNTIA
jgi:transposase InsO family protein